MERLREIFNHYCQYNNGRNEYIDFVRGLAVLSIVFIHTVFWSGYSYIPEFMRNIALLFDVPIFFFCSGAAQGATGKKTLVISAVFKLAISFALLAFISDLIFRNLSFTNTISTLFLDGNALGLPLLAGSYWFVKVYIGSLIVTGVITEYFRKYIPIIVLLFLMYYFLIFIGKLSADFLPSMRYVFFYASVMLLGYYTFFNERIKHRKFRFGIGLVCLAISGGVIFLCKDELFSSPMQTLKFPVSLPYVGTSLISIALIILCYAPNAHFLHFICKIGQESIWFYVGQCVGGSLLYDILPYIKIAWFLKLPVAYICNLFISFVAAIIIFAFYVILTKTNLISRTSR